jgi:hypothetical protein
MLIIFSHLPHGKGSWKIGLPHPEVTHFRWGHAIYDFLPLCCVLFGISNCTLLGVLSPNMFRFFIHIYSPLWPRERSLDFDSSVTYLLYWMEDLLLEQWHYVLLQVRKCGKQIEALLGHVIVCNSVWYPRLFIVICSRYAFSSWFTLLLCQAIPSLA